MRLIINHKQYFVQPLLLLRVSVVINVVISSELEPVIFADPNLQAQKEVYFLIGSLAGRLFATNVIHEDHIGTLVSTAAAASNEKVALVERISELEIAKKELERVDSKFNNLLNAPTFEKEVRSRISDTYRLSDFTKLHSVLFADVDDFKKVNDIIGNDEADERCLSPLAEMIIQSVRKQDLAARHGGEEFAIFLEGEGPEGALTVAKRIQQRTNQIVIPDHGMLGITIGGVSFPQGMDYRQVIRAANNAEREAKKVDGKNQILIQTDLLPENWDGEIA